MMFLFFFLACNIAQSQSDFIHTSKYPFLHSQTDVDSLQSRFPVPHGYKRISVSGFGQWLRNLPVKRGTKQVYSYRKRPISAPSAAVVPLDLGQGDLQQCADSVLRLYGEYRWYRKSVDKLGFHFTSGDRSGWRAWQKGERFQVSGSKVKRVKGKAVADSYPEFRKWLQYVFLYAGTRSLRLDAHKVPSSESVQPGDFFVSPGSPGHAILVLDVARSSDGPDRALLGQGFMPAQNFHVLTESGKHVQQHWFVLPGKTESLRNPSWKPIPRTGLLRFQQEK